MFAYHGGGCCSPIMWWLLLAYHVVAAAARLTCGSRAAPSVPPRRCSTRPRALLYNGKGAAHMLRAVRSNRYAVMCGTRSGGSACCDIALGFVNVMGVSIHVCPCSGRMSIRNGNRHCVPCTSAL